MNRIPIAIRVALRELRGGLRGFRIFLACVVLGVGAIAAVGSISSAIVGGLESDGQAILGGDVSLRTTHRDITPAQREWLAREATPSRSVFMRAMARATGGAERSLIELKAVDGRYPLFGEVVIDPAMPLDEALAERGGRWGAVADPALLDRLGIGLGGAVRVGEALFEVRATMVGEPDRIGGVRPLGLGPRLMIHEGSLPATDLIRPGSQVRYLNRVRLDPSVDLEVWRSALDAAFPGEGWTVRDRTNASPTVQRFVDRTALFMTLVGLTALLVGGVGVGNAVRTYLGGKTATIATLKCLGASSALIFRVYLVQILVMSLAGIAIGLAIGVAAPFVMSALFPENALVSAGLSVYPVPLALAAIFGVLATLVFSLWPLGRACIVRPGALFRHLVAPAQARPETRYIAMTGLAALALAALAVVTAIDKTIALWFVGGAIVSMAVFRLAGGLVVAAARRSRDVRRVAVRLGLANLHRPGAGTASVVMSLGLGLTVLVTVALIEGNMRHQITDALPERAPAYFFIDIQPDQVPEFQRIVHGIDGDADVERTPMLRGRITAVNGTPSDQVKASDEAWVLRGDRGLTWSATVPKDTRIVAGEWWPADYDGPPLVSVSADEARGLGLGVGETLTVDILGRSLTARVASLREVRWGTLRMNFVLVFSPGVIEGAPQTHLATLRTANGLDRRIERAVTDRLPNVTAIRVRDVLDTVNQFLERVGLAVRATGAITIVAGVLVLAGAVAAGHSRRVYESVVLKVLGATRRDVARAFMVEYGLLGVATAAVASMLGSMAAWAVITQVMHVDWVFLPSVVAVTVIAATAITLAFGLLGTWRAMGQKAAPQLRNE